MIACKFAPSNNRPQSAGPSSSRADSRGSVEQSPEVQALRQSSACAIDPRYGRKPRLHSPSERKAPRRRARRPGKHSRRHHRSENNSARSSRAVALRCATIGIPGSGRPPGRRGSPCRAWQFHPATYPRNIEPHSRAPAPRPECVETENRHCRYRARSPSFGGPRDIGCSDPQ